MDLGGLVGEKKGEQYSSLHRRLPELCYKGCFLVLLLGF